MNHQWFPQHQGNILLCNPLMTQSFCPSTEYVLVINNINKSFVDKNNDIGKSPKFSPAPILIP